MSRNRCAATRGDAEMQHMTCDQTHSQHRPTLISEEDASALARGGWCMLRPLDHPMYGYSSPRSTISLAACRCRPPDGPTGG